MSICLILSVPFLIVMLVSLIVNVIVLSVEVPLKKVSRLQIDR